MIVDLEVEPVYRKRLLDPRGRPVDALLPVVADLARRGRGHRRARGRATAGAGRPADRRPCSTPTRRCTRRSCSAPATTS